MRIAVAGLGGAFVRGHLPAMAQLELERKVTLVAAADADARRRDIIRERLPHVPVFAYAGDMLASVACDAFVVATQPAAHAGLVVLGLHHGLHVICEKPLAVTRADHDLVARACAEHRELALVPVHQYRYSPAWTLISRVARSAGRLRIPHSLAIDVHRPGTDSRAASGWRTDIPASGGMLADAGVHFLALAWTIDERLEVLGAARSCYASGHERSAATVRFGLGVLTIHAWRGAPVRRTRLELRLKRSAITWCDQTMTLAIDGRPLIRWHVDALSDRSHVDALYLPLYRDLLKQLRHDSWRTRRTAEVLSVCSTLITLLERTPIDASA